VKRAGRKKREGKENYKVWNLEPPSWNVGLGGGGRVEESGEPTRHENMSIRKEKKKKGGNREENAHWPEEGNRRKCSADFVNWKKKWKKNLTTHHYAGR